LTLPTLDLPFAGTMNPAGFQDNRARNSLPTANTEWPPRHFSAIAWDMRIWSAWHSGSTDELMRAYYAIGANSPLGRQYFATTGEAGLPAPRPGQYRGGLLGSVRRWFHGQPTPPGEKRTGLHVPIAGDIAATSANLLFSQPPALKHDQADAQDYLTDLIDDGTHSTLIEAAETCAALGGVYLRVVWDTDIQDRPWIDLVPPDAAVPEFKYGRLVAVTFWSVIQDTGKEVVRHLEKHIPGQNEIHHGVYVGTQKDLGRSASLTDFPETAPYADLVTDGQVISLPDMGDASTVAYIPNIRPNRIWRDMGPQAAPLGRSDYSGLEGLMDALDESTSSWMRDIRLGKAKLMVPQSMLDNIGRGRGAVFEPEREVMVPLQSLSSGDGPLSQQIVPWQPNIRWAEHKNTCDDLVEKIIGMAGYSGQTMGLQGDIAQTATEVVARERKSLTTRGKKITYWRPGLADIIYGLMAVSKTVFGEDIEPVRPDIEFPDVVLPDALELAQTVAAMRGAGAASIETAVAELHPDWAPEKVAAEVARIYAEENMDMLSRARIAISGAPGESLEQQLADIPEAVGATDVAQQVEAVANATGADSGNED
jgi:A118 family predicted phage portal protein